MAATQRDVAARAGVSPVVVSRVLHNRARSVRVSAATAERVRQAAEELNYRLNVSGRTFRRQRTATIGILHGVGFARNIFEHGSRYFGALMDGIVEAAFERDFAVTLCPKLFGQNPSDWMSDGRFDGLVWYSAIRTDVARNVIEDCPVPLVAIHSHVSDGPKSRPSVICDNQQGIGLAVDHLISLGHRRIAFALVGELQNSESEERHAAFESRMRFHGLDTSEDDLLDVDYAAVKIAGHLSNLRHTAVVCCSEDLASQFVVTADAIGVRIPEQISVVGFDSTDFCNEFRPSLTAVAQPLREMGKAAIELLVDVINEVPNANREVCLPCGFDVRESTAPPKA